MEDKAEMTPVSKELLKPQDQILFHTKGLSLISFGIRMLTKSFFNHVGVYVEEFDKKGYVIEALGRGVVRTPLEKYIENKNYILKVVRLRPEAFRDAQEHEKGKGMARERLYAKIGLKYDWWAIMWLGIKYLAKSYYRKGRKYIPLGNPLESREKFFCSELVCECFSGISSIVKNLFAGTIYPNVQCSEITPKDIGKSKWVEYICGDGRL